MKQITYQYIDENSAAQHIEIPDSKTLKFLLDHEITAYRNYLPSEEYAQADQAIGEHIDRLNAIIHDNDIEGVHALLTEELAKVQHFIDNPTENKLSAVEAQRLAYGSSLAMFTAYRALDYSNTPEAVIEKINAPFARLADLTMPRTEFTCASDTTIFKNFMLEEGKYQTTSFSTQTTFLGEALAANFRTFYPNHNANPEIDANADLNSVMDGFIQQYGRIAFADTHTSHKIMSFVTQEAMPKFKGGVAILEFNTNLQRYFDTYLNTGDENQLREQLDAFNQNVDNHDRNDAYIALAKAARDNQMQIAPINDALGLVSLQIFSGHRIEVTNFIWAEKIDHLGLAADKKAFYLLGTDHISDTHQSNGMIHEHLGMPVIDFAQIPAHHSFIKMHPDIDRGDIVIPDQTLSGDIITAMHTSGILPSLSGEEAKALESTVCDVDTTDIELLSDPAWLATKRKAPKERPITQPW